MAGVPTQFMVPKGRVFLNRLLSHLEHHNEIAKALKIILIGSPVNFKELWMILIII